MASLLYVGKQGLKIGEARHPVLTWSKRGFETPEQLMLMIAQASEEVIELLVDDIAQLFHTLDPFPFRERDLDREAKEYIVGWARELSGRQAIRIRVHHPNPHVQAKAALELREAFGHYFADRANAMQRDIIGRWSLAIALFANPLWRLLEESLLI